MKFLQNIVDTQSFLSSKNIDISFRMKNQSPFIRTSIENQIIVRLYKMIDFDKFVFHDWFGGINEFAIKKKS